MILKKELTMDANVQALYAKQLSTICQGGTGDGGIRQQLLKLQALDIFLETF